jgi:hypothetical protein
MFTPDFARQVGFTQAAIADYDYRTNVANLLLPGAKRSGASDFKLPDRPLPDLPVIVTPRQDEAWRRFPFFPPDRFGTAGVPTTDYRYHSSASQEEKFGRGGVDMGRVEIVKGERADMSGMLGGGSVPQPPSGPDQPGLVAPFLLFCAMPTAEG